MAEGWARHLRGDTVEARSAGIEEGSLDPRAVQVMAEAGVDISGQRSKFVDELEDLDFDYVVTVCDHARERCPLFPGNAKMIHQSFDDPPTLAARESGEEAKLEQYRRVRDEIRELVERLPTD
jgi:arsenate reductase (thioredoxin)